MSQYSHIKMTRQVAEDGTAEEEYDFNAEVTLKAQVHTYSLLAGGITLHMVYY